MIFQYTILAPCVFAVFRCILLIGGITAVYNLQLEKRSLKNHELRIKYSDEPQKFMESEVELNQAIQMSGFVSEILILFSLRL